MAHTLREIAAALNAEVAGDGSLSVERPGHPRAAGPNDLAIAMDAEHIGALAASVARAALLPAGTDWRALGLAGAVLVSRPRHALATLTALHAPPADIAPGISPMAVVHREAEIGDGCAIGPFCEIAAGARIGPGSILRSHVSVGPGARIGPRALIHPGVRIGRGVAIGAGAIIHGNAVIGADGFSFVTPEPGAVESVAATGRVEDAARNTRLVRIHSLGAVRIGDDVEIGAGTTIDRGTLVDTRVGSGTKIDNLVQIGHNVSVGENCLICAQVGIAGSAVIGNRVVLGGQVGVADHVSIGDDTVVGARGAVAANAPARSVLLGTPALPRAEALRITLAMRQLPKLVETVRLLKKRLSAAEPKG
jgi:UDP-3-O-[3-hydroxymyristoyl] glucosamine N-acyltransferase